MERDPYIDSYDNNDIPWIPRQEQLQTWAESPQQTHYQKIQPAPVLPRMSKEEAQNLVHRLKQGLLISSIIGFGTLSWFTTMQQPATASPQPVQLQQFGPSDSSGNFFDQGGNSVGEHHHRRYDFGQDQDQNSGPNQDQNSGPNQDQNSGPNQGQGSGPISGSHVS